MANNKLYIECISCALLAEKGDRDHLVGIAKYYPESGWESVGETEYILDDFFDKHTECNNSNKMQGNTKFQLVFEHHDNKELERI